MPFQFFAEKLMSPLASPFDEAWRIKAVPESLRRSAEKLMTKHRHLLHVNTTNKMSLSAESGNIAG